VPEPVAAKHEYRVGSARHAKLPPLPRAAAFVLAPTSHFKVEDPEVLAVVLALVRKPTVYHHCCIVKHRGAVAVPFARNVTVPLATVTTAEGQAGMQYVPSVVRTRKVRVTRTVDVVFPNIIEQELRGNETTLTLNIFPLAMCQVLVE